jgi:hypothetical protein
VFVKGDLIINTSAFLSITAFGSTVPFVNVSGSVRVLGGLVFISTDDFESLAGQTKVVLLVFVYKYFLFSEFYNYGGRLIYSDAVSGSLFRGVRGYKVDFGF